MVTCVRSHYVHIWTNDLHEDVYESDLLNFPLGSLTEWKNKIVELQQVSKVFGSCTGKSVLRLPGWCYSGMRFSLYAIKALCHKQCPP